MWEINDLDSLLMAKAQSIDVVVEIPPEGIEETINDDCRSCLLLLVLSIPNHQLILILVSNASRVLAFGVMCKRCTKFQSSSLRIRNFSKQAPLIVPPPLAGRCRFVE
jgi:hypothetical protein